MNRRDFISNGCVACLSVTAMSGLLTSCSATRYVSGTVVKDGLTIQKEEFRVNKKSRTEYRSFIIARNDALQYPICIYRFSETEYTALWMSCTHQGTELQASGQYLQCTAHGSEFNNRGKVTSGPADKDLRTFPVTVNNDQLFIDLRKL